MALFNYNASVFNQLINKSKPNCFKSWYCIVNRSV